MCFDLISIDQGELGGGVLPDDVLPGLIPEEKEAGADKEWKEVDEWLTVAGEESFINPRDEDEEDHQAQLDQDTVWIFGSQPAMSNVSLVSTTPSSLMPTTITTTTTTITTTTINKSLTHSS